MTAPRGELGAVVELARAAGDELMLFYRAPAETLGIDFKGPRDLVTTADRRAEARIVESLRRDHPTDVILAEEGSPVAAAPSPAVARTQPIAAPARVWIIDPLDGTTNFAHGHPLFAVSIGRWEDGEPTLAVIHAPALGETFWAERGGGAFLDGRRLSVVDARLDETLLATGFSYGRRELEAGALGCFERLLREAREIRRGGSACLDLAYNAAGVFGGFWEYYLQPHDVAAGALLIQEAGGRVTDCRGGDDFLHGGSIVAGSPPIHERLLDILREGPAHPG